jgi:hypothetical protein
VTCVGLATLNVTSSPYGPCTGFLVQEGAVVETACTGAGPGAIVSVDVFTSPTTPPTLPLANVVFTGVAVGAQS